MKSIRILETTIRDGGYMVDHHYSRSDIALITGGLDRAGLSYVEVGHGNGVGSHFFDARYRSKTWPALGDKDHADVALGVAKRAKIGVLFTAGAKFVPVEYLDEIAAMGFHFVRLAYMPTEFDDLATKYVVRAKQLQLTVAINLMQTYVKTPAEVADIARRAADHGADWFNVVDSSGGMSTDDVKRYVTAVLERAPIVVGLHAHNNLGCAVANALAAVEAGATMVDGTLNGIGRATGNPPTEQLAVALRERGYDIDIDLDALIGLCRSVRSLLEKPGNDPFDVVSGGSFIHSRNVPEVLRAARARNRSPAAYLLEIGRAARERGILSAISYPDEVYDLIAERMPVATEIESSGAIVDVVRAEMLERWHATGPRLFDDLLRRSSQRHKPSALHVSREVARFTDQAVVWEDRAVGTTIPRLADDFAEIETSRVPDYLVLDHDVTPPPFTPKLATFRVPFSAIYARAAQDLVLALRSAGVEPVCEPGGITHAMASTLEPLALGTTRTAGPIALVATDAATTDMLKAGDFLVLLAPWAPDRLAAARATGVRIVRPQWRTALARMVSSLIALRQEVSIVDVGSPLVSDVFVEGPGQGAWDADQAALIASEDPQATARCAAEQYSRMLLRGERGF